MSTAAPSDLPDATTVFPALSEQIQPTRSHTHSKLAVGAHSALIDAAKTPLSVPHDPQHIQLTLLMTAQVYATLELAAQTARLADVQQQELDTLKRDLGYA